MSDEIIVLTKQCEIYLEVALRSSCEIVGKYRIFLPRDADGDVVTILFDYKQLAHDLVSKAGFELLPGCILAVDIRNIIGERFIKADDWMVFGPVTVRFVWPACCIKDKKSRKQTSKPAKQTLRDAIRAQKSNMENGRKDNGNVIDMNCDPVDATPPKVLKNPASRKHQGKSKTFKRKTKRQGRI